MKQNTQRKYFRLTRAERASIERALDKNDSARSMARDLGRSPASVTDEVKRNRTVVKGPGKGERVAEVDEGACTRLLSWPWVCNGCKLRRYHCSKKWKCEYSAARAQGLADEVLVESRKGVNNLEDDFEVMMATLRADIGRGLSPAQIACGRANEFSVHPTTIYRWVAKGYGGMSNVELRRKVGYKPRKSSKKCRCTSHGTERSYASFSALADNDRARACEMDTVIGKASDTQCILTLYLRPCKVQLTLLLFEKSSSAVAAALDSLEKSIGKPLFQRLFGLILTDNGSEFSDTDALEKSALPGKRTRTKVYYCDPRQSQQKGSCEKNHVELRKILPKRRGISFNDLEVQDLVVVMSHLNSEPRASLMGLSPFALLRAANIKAYKALLFALGVEEVPYENLNLKVNVVNASRKEHGLPPLI